MNMERRDVVLALLFLNEVRTSVDYQFFYFDLRSFTWLREVRFGSVYVGRDTFRFFTYWTRYVGMSYFMFSSRFYLSVKTSAWQLVYWWVVSLLPSLFYGKQEEHAGSNFNLNWKLKN